MTLPARPRLAHPLAQRDCCPPDSHAANTVTTCRCGWPTRRCSAAPGQGTRQIVELLIAFGLTALIGLEREIHGKSAGLRTQAIVGTASALILIVSKYGFFDVLTNGLVEVDPSRVAAQIVSGIGFLGAGLIITRQARCTD